MSEKDSVYSYQLIPCPSCNQAASYQVNLPRGAMLYLTCIYCRSSIAIRTNMNCQIERISKNTEASSVNGGNKMKKCPNCGKELKDEAKFCSGCGYKFPAAQNTAQPQADAALSKADIEKQASFIQWNILPGQLGLKIDAREIASYGRVKGLVIQEGVKALFFVNGKISAQLDAGKYEFKSFPDVSFKDDTEEKKQGRVAAFFNNIRNFFRSTPQFPSNVQNVNVVLVRSTEFPLVFSVKDVATSGVRSEVGLHFLCRISNINDFYASMLLDKTFVSFESVKNQLEPVIKNVLNSALASFPADNLNGAQDALLAALKTQVSSIYSYFDVNKIISLTAQNEELERIRKLQEELYISELELTELTKRNKFLNRLQDENNAQELREARSQVDFQAAMDKIDQDRELNEDERLKFSQMLEAQRLIREAKTQDEIDAAMAVFEKSGMLREEELDNVRAQVEQNAALRDLSYEQALNLATLSNEKELDRQRLQWEIEVGNQRIQNELERQRMQTAYEDERRQKEMEMDKQEQLTQLELLRQAQAIRNEREQAEHQRQMEANAQKIQHEEEMRRMFQNMTAEQIVAANPDITPEAAVAMAEKFKAEAAAAANDKTAQMAMKQSADMQAFMQQQMQMMRDMAVAGMGMNAQNQQNMMASKDAEMNRFAGGVNNAVSSVAGALKNPNTVVQGMPGATAGTAGAPLASEAKAAHVCPGCGTPYADGAIFCENCGTSL